MNKGINLNEANQTITCDYDSSSVKSTLYHIDTQHLVVDFAKGNKVTYFPVTITLHNQLMLAESIGKEFAKKVQRDPKIDYFPGDRSQFLTEAIKYGGRIPRK